MKTAMQELMGLVEQMFVNAKTIEVESAMNDVINIITQEGLKKEKEQIMIANQKGYVEGGRYFTFGMQPISSEEYYNQTYKQEVSPQDPAVDDMLEIEETEEEAAYRKGYMDGYDEGLYDGMYK
jgi:hypothetical protein